MPETQNGINYSKLCFPLEKGFYKDYYFLTPVICVCTWMSQIVLWYSHIPALDRMCVIESRSCGSQSVWRVAKAKPWQSGNVTEKREENMPKHHWALASLEWLRSYYSLLGTIQEDNELQILQMLQILGVLSTKVALTSRTLRP